MIERKSSINNDVSIGAYATTLTKNGVVMLIQEGNNVIVQKVPSEIMYHRGYTTFMNDYQSDDLNYFKKKWGWEPTSLVYWNYFYSDLKDKWQMLINATKIRKIVLVDFDYSKNNLKHLMNLMEKQNDLKICNSNFIFGKKENKSAWIIVYTHFIIFIIDGKLFSLKIDGNHMKIHGCIMKRTTIGMEEFCVLKLCFIHSKNLNIQLIDGDWFSNSNDASSFCRLSNFTKQIYICIRVKDINKISNLKLKYFKILSESTVPTKMAINLKFDWAKYDEESILRILEKIPNFIEIELNNLYFWINYLESEFWKTVLKFKSTIINLNSPNYILIKKNSGKKILLFTFWTKNAKVQISFEELLDYLTTYISNSNEIN